ncbi:hypothetical protein PAL_GLEAN10009495 [Pteropus alecto]|uniref:Uncharacterized protein n=1 Tax=Pteropus alecto TaxID=9402 RepID=L5L5E7_PTEAL|nr:hypothetical protein PAL_GLEAN10009495 [Pteropus alecto]
MALPTLAAPALLGLETPENLCPCDLSPNGPHQHVPHLPQQRAEETQTWASELPFLPRTSGAYAWFTAEASSTVHLV